MSISLIEGDWIFRTQIDILPNKQLQKTEVCHKKVFYETNPDGTANYENIKAEVPGINIIELPSVEEFEVEFPGYAEKLQFVQVAMITVALRKINEASSFSESVPVPESVSESLEVTQ